MSPGARGGRRSLFGNILHRFRPDNNNQKSPVPCTPPPRSYDGSIERPRPQHDIRKTSSHDIEALSRGDEAGTRAQITPKKKELEDGKTKKGDRSSRDAVPRRSQRNIFYYFRPVNRKSAAPCKTTTRRSNPSLARPRPQFDITKTSSHDIEALSRWDEARARAQMTPKKKELEDVKTEKVDSSSGDAVPGSSQGNILHRFRPDNINQKSPVPGTPPPRSYDGSIERPRPQFDITKTSSHDIEALSLGDEAGTRAQMTPKKKELKDGKTKKGDSSSRVAVPRRSQRNIFYYFRPVNRKSAAPCKTTTHRSNPSLARPRPQHDIRKTSSHDIEALSLGDEAGTRAQMTPKNKELKDGKTKKGDSSSRVAVPRRSQRNIFYYFRPVNRKSAAPCKTTTRRSNPSLERPRPQHDIRETSSHDIEALSRWDEARARAQMTPKKKELEDVKTEKVDSSSGDAVPGSSQRNILHRFRPDNNNQKSPVPCTPPPRSYDGSIERPRPQRDIRKTSSHDIEALSRGDEAGTRVQMKPKKKKLEDGKTKKGDRSSRDAVPRRSQRNIFHYFRLVNRKSAVPCKSPPRRSNPSQARPRPQRDIRKTSSHDIEALSRWDEARARAKMTPKKKELEDVKTEKVDSSSGDAVPGSSQGNLLHRFHPDNNNQKSPVPCTPPPRSYDGSIERPRPQHDIRKTSSHGTEALSHGDQARARAQMTPKKKELKDGKTKKVDSSSGDAVPGSSQRNIFHYFRPVNRKSAVPCKSPPRRSNPSLTRPRPQHDIRKTSSHGTEALSHGHEARARAQMTPKKKELKDGKTKKGDSSSRDAVPRRSQRNIFHYFRLVNRKSAVPCKSPPRRSNPSQARPRPQRDIRKTSSHDIEALSRWDEARARAQMTPKKKELEDVKTEKVDSSSGDAVPGSSQGNILHRFHPDNNNQKSPVPCTPPPRSYDGSIERPGPQHDIRKTSSHDIEALSRWDEARARAQMTPKKKELEDVKTEKVDSSSGDAVPGSSQGNLLHRFHPDNNNQKSPVPCTPPPRSYDGSIERPLPQHDIRKTSSHDIEALSRWDEARARAQMTPKTKELVDVKTEKVDSSSGDAVPGSSQRNLLHRFHPDNNNQKSPVPGTPPPRSYDGSIERPRPQHDIRKTSSHGTEALSHGDQARARAQMTPKKKELKDGKTKKVDSSSGDAMPGSSQGNILHRFHPDNINQKSPVPGTPPPRSYDGSIERPRPQRDIRKTSSHDIEALSHRDEAGARAQMTPKKKELEDVQTEKRDSSSGDAVPGISQVKLTHNAESESSESFSEQDEFAHFSSFLQHRISQKEDPVSSELLHLRKEVQELKNENDDLKITLQLLTAELGRCQEKIKSLSKEELNMKRLSPLLLSYEERIKEKDELVGSLQEEINTLKNQVQEADKEKEELRQKLKNTVPVDTWTSVMTHTERVVKENELLLEQLKQQRMKDTKTREEHLLEVSALTKKVEFLENNAHFREKVLMTTKQQLESTQAKYEKLEKYLDQSIQFTVHVTIVETLERYLQKQINKGCAEIKELKEKLTAVEKDKNDLLLKNNNLTYKKEALETELEKTKNKNMKYQMKIGMLGKQVEVAMNKEETANWHLANAVGMAKNVSQAQDNYKCWAKSLENENQKVLNRIKKGNILLENLEAKMEWHKKEEDQKLDYAHLHLLEQQEEFANKTMQYLSEMRHLQSIAQEKQEVLNEELQQKRKIEEKLEVALASTYRENQRMLELLKPTPKKTSIWDDTRDFKETLLSNFSQRDLPGCSHFTY